MGPLKLLRIFFSSGPAAVQTAFPFEFAGSKPAPCSAERRSGLEPGSEFGKPAFYFPARLPEEGSLNRS